MMNNKSDGDMKKFERISTSSKHNFDDIDFKINIAKYKKLGTSRYFYTPEKPDGTRITRTMFQTKNAALSCIYQIARQKRA